MGPALAGDIRPGVHRDVRVLQKELTIALVYHRTQPVISAGDFTSLGLFVRAEGGDVRTWGVTLNFLLHKNLAFHRRG